MTRQERVPAARKPRGRVDMMILFCVGTLVVFGLVMLASASSYVGKERFDDSYYYLKHQIVNGLIVGLAGFFAGFFVHYRRYARFSLWFLLISLAVAALTLTPLGVTVKGATRWLDAGPFTFQPAELLKLTFIIYLAAWLSRDLERSRHLFRGFFPFLAVLSGVATLLFIQRSTSIVALLVAVAFIMYFLSGAKLRYLGAIGLVAVLVFVLVIWTTPYRLNRVLSFLEQGADPEGGGFHLNQALIAIGSGGLTGVGYGRSTSKVSYLPESIGDSIFAVTAEELGFIGAGALVALFGVLVTRIFLLSFKTRDRFGNLLLIGFGTTIGLQAFINIAALTGILPLTGLPLPFVSYGGTSLAVFVTMAGIIANISKYR